jgi:hypothetical protein
LGSRRQRGIKPAGITSPRPETLMAAADDHNIPALLSHLAYLHEGLPGEEIQPRTLRWAKRVYNAVVRLQFRYKYRDAGSTTLDRKSEVEIGAAIERVVDLAASVVEPLRAGGTKDRLDQLLQRETAQSIGAALANLLATAQDVGWLTGAAPTRDHDLERRSDVATMLAAWYRAKYGERVTAPSPASDAEPLPAAEAQAEFLASLALKLTAAHSPQVAALPDKAAQIVTDVAEAFFKSACEGLGAEGGNQRLQAIADNARRSRANRG